MDHHEEVFAGVHKLGKFLLTKNISPGKKVYGEQLITLGGIEYREWDPYRSKLAAAIRKGLVEFPIKEGEKILYLGSAEGTTISHISDIVGNNGMIFGVDVSAKAMQKFLYMCESRENIIPILGDAKEPATYLDAMGGCKADLIYQDISQREQATIFLKNAGMHLKTGGYGMLMIKARSISSEGSASKIILEETGKIMKEFEIIQSLDLEPFDSEHGFILCRRK